MARSGCCCCYCYTETLCSMLLYSYIRSTISVYELYHTYQGTTSSPTSSAPRLASHRPLPLRPSSHLLCHSPSAVCVSRASCSTSRRSCFFVTVCIQKFVSKPFPAAIPLLSAPPGAPPSRPPHHSSHRRSSAQKRPQTGEMSPRRPQWGAETPPRIRKGPKRLQNSLPPPRSLLIRAVRSKSKTANQKPQSWRPNIIACPCANAAPPPELPLSIFRAPWARPASRGPSTRGPLPASGPARSRASRVRFAYTPPSWASLGADPFSQPPSPSPSGRHGPGARYRASRTRMASSGKWCAMSRPPSLGACSTVTRRPPTRPPVLPFATASSRTGTRRSSARPFRTPSASTTSVSSS